MLSAFLGAFCLHSCNDLGDGGKYDNALKPAAVGLGAKSYWKFGGSIVPNVPVYVEVALAELEPDNEGNVGYSNLYKRNSLDLGDGMKNFLTDLMFDPIYWFGGQGSAKTYLGHFKTGVETGWVDWTTGYKYAKLPRHKNVNWDTVDQEWEAGYLEVGGYNHFATGTMFNEWVKGLTDGNVDLNVVFAPNRSADRAGNRYGVFSYANATLFGNHYIDVQYNGAYGTEFDKVLDEIYENDLIFGYKGTFGPLTFKGNYLLNLYGSQEVTVGGTKYKSFFNPASSDVGAVNDDVDDKQDNMAANVNITFSNDFITAMVGYRFRGAQANMMYVEQGADDHDHLQDNLGYLNRQRFFADINVTPTDALSIGVVPYLETKFNKDVDSNDAAHNFKNKDTMLLVVRPKVGFKISDNMAIDGYGEVSYISEDEDKFVRGSDKENFVFNEAGLKFAATFVAEVVVWIESVQELRDECCRVFLADLLACSKRESCRKNSSLVKVVYISVVSADANACLQVPSVRKTCFRKQRMHCVFNFICVSVVAVDYIKLSKRTVFKCCGKFQACFIEYKVFFI